MATELSIMQRENLRSRMTVVGARADNGERCTLLAIHETGETWAIYPHGAGQLGVRLATADALKVAQAILTGTQ